MPEEKRAGESSEQERQELPSATERVDTGSDTDAQALAQAYREAAAELMADPLFDLDSGHGLSPDDKWQDK